MECRSLVLTAALVLAASPARAQSPTTGAIEGRVLDAKTHDPLPGIMVTVAGDGQAEPQMAITDDDGRYKVTELLPGSYRVTFYGESGTVIRDHVRVGANDVVPVFQVLRDGVIHVEGPPPQIKLTRTDLSLKLDRDYLTKVPQPGLTADQAAGSKAGAQNDGVGVAYAGSTALENRFLVDGIDITGLTFGNVGTAVINDFVEEIEVLSGGFDAEWGRAIGGIVNIVTKTGTNELRGSVFGTFAPGFLARGRETTPTNAASIDVVGDRAYDANLGFDLGGPVIRDRLWFYVGFAPRRSRTDFTRITKRQTDCRQLLSTNELSGCDPRLTTQGGFADGAPDIDPATGFFITDEVDREVRTATSEGLSAIGKLNLAVTPRHQAAVTAIVNPSRSRTPGLFGLPTTGSRARGLTLDTSMRWTTKSADSKTELAAVVAWHHSSLETGALDPAFDRDPRQLLQGGTLGTWTALGGESRRTAAGCTDGVPGSADPYPAIANCPMDTLSYAIGGPGGIAHDREDRRSIRLSVLRRARLAGTHELKAGIDLDDNTKTTARLFSGGALIQNFVGTLVDVTRFVALAPPGATDARFDRTCSTPDPDGGGTSGGGTKTFACAYLAGTSGAPGTEVEGETLDGAVFVRDSWQPRTNLTLNAGLRYEEQRLRFARALRDSVDPLTGQRHGTNALALGGNWAPRLGAIWDPTEVGASKLWLSYGRFFEAIPMDINDRSFGGEVSYQQTFLTSGGAPSCGPVDPALGGANGVGCLDTTAPPDREQLIGGSGVLVAPGTRAQYLDEVVGGAEYQLLPDTKLGVVVQRRWLGRVIEDLSTDGAQTYVIANPGEWSADAERRLRDELAATTDPEDRARLGRELQTFRGIRAFDKPSRDYLAIELSLSRRFARGLFASASYTYSRTTGNFPGSVSYDNGQIDPNISSQYDLIELLANRDGHLPQDRPHSFKLDAFYTLELDHQQALTFGTRLRAISGIPRNALGAHYLYGPDESFLLPRGQLGRTGIEHSVDLKLAYTRRLSRGVTAELFVDVFNLFNTQGTFDVDRTYAPAIRLAGPGMAGGSQNNVNPISGGSYEDLIFAKTIDASGTESSLPTARNPNFGRTITRYAPSSARFGFRVVF